MDITVKTQDGDVRIVSGQPGASLMETLRGEGVEISSVCGGLCSCGTCHVFVAPEWFGKVGVRGGDEADLLEALPDYRPEASRLSCQIRLAEPLDGLSVEVAPGE